MKKVLRDLTIIVTLIGFFFVVGSVGAGGLIGFNLPVTPRSPVQDNLVVYYTFDDRDIDIAGASASDSSSFNDEAVLVSLTSSSHVEGVFGKAVDFDGAADYVQIQDNSRFDLTTGHTISAWIKTSNSTTENSLFRSIVSKENTAYVFLLHTTGTVRLFANSNYRAQSTTNVADGEWHHVVSVFDDTNDLMQIYVDGVREDNSSYTLNPGTNSANVLIGSQTPTAGAFDGLIDDVRIYNQPISYDEVQKLYAIGNSARTSSGFEDTTDLLAHYTFDAGRTDISASVALDDSQNNNQGTLVNMAGANVVQGRLAGGLVFDGADDSVSLPASAGLDGQGTISMWIKPNSFSTKPYLWIDAQDGVNENRLFAPSGTLYFSGYDNGAYQYELTSPLALGEWQHIIATFQDNDARLYINGTLADSDSLVNMDAFTHNYVEIGDRNTDDPAAETFDGIIDDVRIYNTSLTEAQVAQLYTSSAPTHMSDTSLRNTDGLIAHHSFDGQDIMLGTNTSSDIAGSYDATLSGFSTSTASVTGQSGSALNFDGTDNVVTITHDAALNAYPLTVSAWILTDTTSGDLGIVNKYLSSSLNGWQIFTQDGDLCAWYFRSGSNNVYDGTGNCTMRTAGYNDGNWHHVVFTVGATGGVLYVDGVQVGTQAWAGSPGSTTSTADVRIGYYNGGSYFDGQIDDVRIYNKALSASEVLGLYSATK